MDLKELRDNIDAIDSQLVKLFKQRMALSKDIAEYKMKKAVPVLDTERERKLLNKVSNEAGEEFETYIRVLFSSIMDVSRSYQNKIHSDGSPLLKKISFSIINTPKLFPDKAVVACQGVEGAYSQMACDKIFALPDIMYMKTFENVFSAVESGLCQYGIFPIENSSAGSVNQIYDLMSNYDFNIVRSVRLHVGHSLLAKKGARLTDLTEIFSHEQAISQCSGFLKNLKDVRVTECENTAMAAKQVAESQRTDVAAISSKSCAELYNLTVLSQAVQNTDNNFTRFICLSKELEIYPGADRTSLMLTVPHTPGSLSRVISRFSSLGINLIKIESRPISGQNFEFMFYFDIDTNIYSPAFPQLIGELENQLEYFKYLGSYSEII